VQRKSLFDTNAGSNTADGERTLDALATAGLDYDTLKNLNTLFVAFADFLMNTNELDRIWRT